jgi:hypothetical protein
MAKFEGKDSANLVDNVMSDLDNKIDDELKQASGFLGIGGGNESSQNTKIKNSITNDLTKNVTNELINKLATSIAVNQELKINNLIVDPCGKGPGLKMGEKLLAEGKLSFKDFMAATKDACDAQCGSIDQDVQIKFVSEQLGSKINETIAENKMVQKLKQDIKTKTDQEQTGIGGAVAKGAKGIGEGVGSAAEGVGTGVGTAAEGVGSGVGAAAGGMMMPSLISGCVVCVIVAGGAAFMMSPAGQKAAGGMGGKMGKMGKMCFSGSTKVKMASGENMCIKDISLGDELAGGTLVDATMQIKNRSNDPFYRFNSTELGDCVYVTGSHYIHHDDKYIFVEDHPEAVLTDKCDDILYCLVTSDHTIPVGEFEFWDWEDNLIK